MQRPRYREGAVVWKTVRKPVQAQNNQSGGWREVRAEGLAGHAWGEGQECRRIRKRRVVSIF